MKSILIYLGLTCFSLNLAHSQEIILENMPSEYQKSYFENTDINERVREHGLNRRFWQEYKNDSSEIIFNRNEEGGLNFVKNSFRKSVRDFFVDTSIVKNQTERIERVFQNLLDSNEKKVGIDLKNSDSIRDFSFGNLVEKHNVKLGISPVLSAKIGNVLSLDIYPENWRVVLYKRLGGIDYRAGVERGYFGENFKGFIGCSKDFTNGFLSSGFYTNRYEQIATISFSFRY